MIGKFLSTATPLWRRWNTLQHFRSEGVWLDHCALKILVLYSPLYVSLIAAHWTTCIFVWQKTSTAFEETSNQFEASAAYISSQEIHCSLPQEGSFYLRVSNNGLTTSTQRLRRILYSSQCEVCTTSACTTRVSGWKDWGKILDQLAMDVHILLGKHSD